MGEDGAGRHVPVAAPLLAAVVVIRALTLGALTLGALTLGALTLGALGPRAALRLEARLDAGPDPLVAGRRLVPVLYAGFHRRVGTLVTGLRTLGRLGALGTLALRRLGTVGTLAVGTLALVAVGTLGALALGAVGSFGALAVGSFGALVALDRAAVRLQLRQAIVRGLAGRFPTGLGVVAGLEADLGDLERGGAARLDGLAVGVVLRRHAPKLGLGELELRLPDSVVAAVCPLTGDEAHAARCGQKYIEAESHHLRLLPEKVVTPTRGGGLAGGVPRGAERPCSGFRAAPAPTERDTVKDARQVAVSPPLDTYPRPPRTMRPDGALRRRSACALAR
jgi:hypothetical protein